MAKDPAFLFYPNDYIGGTMGFTFEEKGAYMDLLILQFNRGPFTETQAKHILSICDAYVWDTLKQKFQTDGERYWNQRLHDEIERRKKYTESRRRNALGNKNVETTIPDDGEHMQQHMENRNENKNSIEKRKSLFINGAENVNGAIKSSRGANHALTKSVLKEFIDYWTEHGPRDKKMRFEKERSWDIIKRIARWLKNEQKHHAKKHGFPDEPDMGWYNSCRDSQLLQKAAKHWRSKGWKRVTNKKGDTTGWDRASST